jgi:hypothetical protein
MGLLSKILGTISNSFTIGDGAAGDKYVQAETGVPAPPFVRYNDTTKLWEISNNGVAVSAPIHRSFANEIHAITSKAVPEDADEVLIEDSTNSWNKKRVALSTIGKASYPAYQYATSATAPTTNLAAYNPPTTLLPGMQVTALVSGLYRMQLNLEWQGTSSATVGAFALTVNNLMVTNSTRRSRVTAGGAWMNLMVEAVGNVTAGQVVQADWWVFAGGTLTAGNRFFSIMRVG